MAEKAKKEDRSLRVWRIDDGEIHHYIARSEKNAVTTHASNHGYGYKEYMEEYKDNLTVGELGPGTPLRISYDDFDEKIDPIILKASEWVAIFNTHVKWDEALFLCITCY